MSCLEIISERGASFWHRSKEVYINADCLMMARGGITIEDDAQLAANIQLLTNNHDLYEREILPCKPILICKGAWIGAGVTVLPGIRIGKHAVVGAAAGGSSFTGSCSTGPEMAVEVIWME